MACPICGQPAEPKFRPFCSKRCADVDLARWLGGRYRIPTDEPPTGGQTDLPGDEDDPPRH
ncbi:DNA gyrase inhibitor YacG [Wenxinia marina]|uniref:DNA gyrase inhibitor YacG n=1 Tax=Wenxinia marina DSM 24838 TaxID=1123501 RepID=A0A0D0PFE9_9RHOB|nr:DNA gyrase inhibitor YacG [Wenxinia marina]KIQ70076.1 hypothetical protein Wenmar_01647 [Wenxinia marina DSM 24838]GGL63325.1 DNA gyrase inhibitor YacG [Wenxinia marina]